MEHKTKENAFTWLPIQERKSRFGDYRLSHLPEFRHPLLWLTKESNELYLVNLSGETLDFVAADSGGFVTGDDDTVALGGVGYKYTNVKPNDAVLVEKYDYFLDHDSILNVEVTIQSKSIGCLSITTYPDKGGVHETVLLWDTLEYGKNVMNVKKLDPVI